MKRVATGNQIVNCFNIVSNKYQDSRKESQKKRLIVQLPKSNVRENKKFNCYFEYKRKEMFKKRRRIGFRNLY